MKFELSKVIGHRGACGHAPENTLISMSKAHELGARWVEFDVMLAGCGEPIVMHDFTLERTTNGIGAVHHSEYRDLVSLDCGSWFSDVFIGQKIPSLEQLLSHVSSLDLGINLEIKPQAGKEQHVAHRTIEALTQHWPDTCLMPLISSSSKEVLQSVYTYQRYPIGYILDSWHKDWRDTIENFDCISVHADHRILTEKRVQEIKDMGKLVLAYTVNDIIIAKRLYDWGVDAIFTDYPDQILTLFSNPAKIV